MHMVVLLLLISILLYKTVSRLSFRVFSVVITWLVKYDRDFKTSKEQISANGLWSGSKCHEIKSRGNFVKKASHLSRCIKGTLRNMVKVVGNFVTSYDRR